MMRPCCILALALQLHIICCGSDPLTAPLRSVANITCRNVTNPMWWQVQFVGNMTALRLPNDAGILATRGVSYALFNASQSSMVPYSVLHVNATVGNNGTTVKCFQLYSTGRALMTATLIVYDRPLPPTNHTVSVYGNGSLLVTWVPPLTFLGVKLQYKVTVRDNVTEETAMVENCSYIYHSTHDDSKCPQYGISVRAVNSAGESDPSEVQVSIPLVPQIDTQQHLQLVVISRGGVAAYFKISVDQNCPDFPVQSYIVKLYNIVLNTTLTMKCQLNVGNCSMEEMVVHTSDGLQPNMKYIYTITAVNMVGNSTSSPQAFYTTDVQSSTITGSDYKLNVTCFFAEGTQARGCAVCLEKSGGVVYQMVPRVNETAKGVIRTEFSVDCYNISVVDWEEDGSTGSLSVPVTITTIPVLPGITMGISIQGSTSSESTATHQVPSTAMYQALPSHVPTLPVLGSGRSQQSLWLIPIVCTIAATLVVAAVFCFIVLCRHIKGKSKRDKTTYESSEKEERIYEAVSNQRAIYATLEPPLRLDATNPTYMINYDTSTSSTPVSNEYAVPLDNVNIYATPNNIG